MSDPQEVIVEYETIDVQLLALQEVTVEREELGVEIGYETINVEIIDSAVSVQLETGGRGPQGEQGPTGPAPAVITEIPSGAVDGENRTFTLSSEPIKDTLQVALNGLIQDEGDFSHEGLAVIFHLPPLPDYKIVARYFKEE